MRHKLQTIVLLSLCLSVSNSPAKVYAETVQEVPQEIVVASQLDLGRMAGIVNKHTYDLIEVGKYLSGCAEMLNKHSGSIRQQHDGLLCHKRILNRHKEKLQQHEEDLMNKGHVLNNHAGTLKEHADTLDDHACALNKHAGTLEEHADTLDDHASALNDHANALNKHAGTLDDHADTLDNHACALNKHADTLDDHASALNNHAGTLDNHASALNNHAGTLDNHANTLQNHAGTLDDHAIVLNDHAGTLKDHAGTLNDHADTLTSHKGILKRHGTRMDGHEVRMNNMQEEYTAQFSAHKSVLDTHTRDISNLNSRVGELTSDLGKVGASAAALAALHPLDFDPDAKLDVTAGMGHYRGKSALAVGVFYHPEENIQLNAGCTLGDRTIFNMGVSFKLDGRKRTTRTKETMAKEIIDLRTQVEMLATKLDNMTAK